VKVSISITIGILSGIIFVLYYLIGIEGVSRTFTAMLKTLIFMSVILGLCALHYRIAK
jgi:hypothetical protein